MTPYEICEHLGGDKHAGYFLTPCPCCQPEGRRDQRSLSIRDEGGRLLMHCHKSNCAFHDILVALGISDGSYKADFAAIEQARIERRAEVAKKLTKAQRKWSFAKPINGSKGETYLRSRGITSALPNTLRWSPDEFHPPSGVFGSAIIALVEPTGAIHRTFFDKKGNRLPRNAKLMLGPCRSGAVRLSQGGGPLVVCEGIETGLSLLSGLLTFPATVWAAMSTSGMRGLELPSAPSELIVAVDGDHAGRAAGLDLMQCATRAGWKVSHLTPPFGQDWNDVLQSGVAA